MSTNEEQVRATRNLDANLAKNPWSTWTSKMTTNESREIRNPSWFTNLGIYFGFWRRDSVGNLATWMHVWIFLAVYTLPYSLESGLAGSPRPTDRALPRTVYSTCRNYYVIQVLMHGWGERVWSSKYLVLVPGGSGKIVPLVIKLCRRYGDMSQRSGTPWYRRITQYAFEVWKDAWEDSKNPQDSQKSPQLYCYRQSIW